MYAASLSDPEGGTLAMLCRMADAIDERMPGTHGHSRRVAALSEALARAMDLPAAAVAETRLAARLHDIGNMAIPSHFANHPGELSEAEWGRVAGHTTKGAGMLHLRDEWRGVARAIQGHHEHWDGSGYPDGLSGESIPLAARLIAVAEAYDAMISHRPYREPLDASEALDELCALAGSRYDPTVIAAFEQLARETPERLKS
jgi:putative nucleotidyltransferase with HDIG domain